MLLTHLIYTHYQDRSQVVRLTAFADVISRSEKEFIQKYKNSKRAAGPCDSGNGLSVSGAVTSRLGGFYLSAYELPVRAQDKDTARDG